MAGPEFVPGIAAVIEQEHQCAVVEHRIDISVVSAYSPDVLLRVEPGFRRQRYDRDVAQSTVSLAERCHPAHPAAAPHELPGATSAEIAARCRSIIAVLHQGRISPTALATFFESLDGARLLRVMAWARRQLAVSDGPQLAAERLLRDADLVFLPDPLAEIDDPPADHAVHRRDRAVLDHRRKRCALFVIEPRRLAGSLAVDQSWTVRVEPQNPITHNLQRHPASRRRLRAAAHRRSMPAPTIAGPDRRPHSRAPDRAAPPHHDPASVGLLSAWRTSWSASLQSDRPRVGEPR